jgi:hypothetical protein
MLQKHVDDVQIIFIQGPLASCGESTSIVINEITQTYYKNEKMQFNFHELAIKEEIEKIGFQSALNFPRKT